jgi:hypothetical protein
MAVVQINIMKTKLLTFLPTLTYLFLFCSLPILLGLDMDDGREALERNDYKEAARSFRFSAEQGNPEGQFALGVIYFSKEGMHDYKKAAQWFRPAAEQGHTGAQLLLGSMYRFGNGVSQDYVLAHMWNNLSNLQGRKVNKNVLEKKMTPQQIEEAKELARNWKPDRSKSIWQKLKTKIKTLNE